MGAVKNFYHDEICGTRPASPPKRSDAIKCVGCGKFISYDDMGEDGPARFQFEPLSEFGPEVSEWSCADCAEPF
jgi:hypothetical protein